MEAIYQQENVLEDKENQATVPKQMAMKAGMQRRSERAGGIKSSKAASTFGQQRSALGELQYNTQDKVTIVRDKQGSKSTKDGQVQKQSNYQSKYNAKQSVPQTRIESAQQAQPAQAQAQRIKIVDIDSMNENQELQVSGYSQHYYAYYKRVEDYFVPSFNYMDSQEDISPRMRAILNDWLVDVHYKFKLNPETLFLAIQIIDRYLSCYKIARNNLQLVGCVAMLIACKYEEIYAPEVHDLVYISDSAYQKEQILAMEVHMLNALQYQLTVPTQYMFVNRYLKAILRYDHSVTRYLAFFLIELTLIDYGFLQYKPSQAAAAAVLLAYLYTNKKVYREKYMISEGDGQSRDGDGCTMLQSKGLGKDDLKYPAQLEYYTQYKYQDIHDCAKDLLQLHQNQFLSSQKLKAVVKKYNRNEFHEVANTFSRALKTSVLEQLLANSS